MDRPLLNKLLDSAKAIERGEFNLADSLFKEILSANEVNAATGKVVRCFAEALVRRLCKLYPQDHPRPIASFKSIEAFLDYGFLPFLWFANFTTHASLTDALTGRKQVHFIDFAFTATIWQYYHLMEKFATQPGGAPLSFRITFVGPKVFKKGNYLEEFRRRLSVDAQRFRIDFEFTDLDAYSADDIVESTLKLSRASEDETVIVKWEFELHKLLALPGAIEKVLYKLKDLKPAIMVIVEQETNHNGPDFLNWLDQSFEYYYNIFESLEDTYYDFDDYKKLWEAYFRRQISNVVAREGIRQVEQHENSELWQNRLRNAGFRPVRLRFDERDLFGRLPQYKIMEKRRCPVLSRHNFLLAAASAWKPDPTQSNDGLFDGNQLGSLFAGVSIAQDASPYTVIGESGMANYSESNQTEANNPHLLSAECFFINRIAASAEIYDMLEYLCHEHDLPLALTWISDRNEGNASLTGKQILRVENSACYVKDFTMNEFVEACGKKHLEEGQGVAGKALLSNTMCFVSDVSVLEVDDYPFICAAWEFGLHAAIAIKIARTNHFNANEYVLELFLPTEMREISELGPLIDKISSTLRCNHGNFWRVCCEESSGDNNIGSANSSDQDARMPDVAPEAASSSNSSLQLSLLGSFTSSQLKEFDVHFPKIQPERAEETPVEANIDQELESALQPDQYVTRGPNKRRRSEVWNYFDEIREDGAVWAKCKGCGKQYRGESTIGTNHLWRHHNACSANLTKS